MASSKASTEAEIDIHRLLTMKKLAARNGEINKMSRSELQGALSKDGLKSDGNKDILKKRLKDHIRRRVLTKEKVPQLAPTKPHFDYYIVIDYEATCQEKNPSDFQHEIIEFPAILVDACERKIISEFHQYVRPVLSPRLTEFCTALTGITQGHVDKSRVFTDVMVQFEDWLEDSIPCGKTYAILTDGPWDMFRFLQKQCVISNLEFPDWAKKWVNIRKIFSNFYGQKRMGLKAMLDLLGMQFEGHQHSGIDDTRNITRILLHLLCDSAKVRQNEQIVLHRDSKTGQIIKAAYDNIPADSVKIQVKGESASGSNNSVSLCNKIQDLSVSGDTDLQGATDDDIDDLLSYYSLQKS